VVVGASVAIYVRDSTTGLFNVLLLAGLATALLLRWLARKGM
jgi:hypothetical protein